MNWKQNEGMYTDQETIILNILKAMKKTTWQEGIRKSGMGYAAYPDYRIRTPQGAAFSIAKVSRMMLEDKLIAWGRCSMEYYITTSGSDYLSENSKIHADMPLKPEFEL